MGKNNKNKTIDNLSDKKVLEAMYELLNRAEIHTKLISDDTGMVTHQMVVVTCGDKFFAAEPQPLDPPLIPVETTRTLN